MKTKKKGKPRRNETSDSKGDQEKRKPDGKEIMQERKPVEKETRGKGNLPKKETRISETQRKGNQEWWKTMLKKETGRKVMHK